MSDAPKCSKCGREKRRPNVPDGASPELAACIESAARICLYCYDLNLLAGGYTPAGFDDRYDEIEGIAMRVEALKVGERRQLHWRQRASSRRNEKKQVGEQVRIEEGV
jgi:hypothetical protein